MEVEDEHEGIVKNLLHDLLHDLRFQWRYEHEVYDERVLPHDEYHSSDRIVPLVVELNEWPGEDDMGEYEVMETSTLDDEIENIRW